MKHALSIGSRGTEVKELKTLLNQRVNPNPKLVINDLFDKETDKAVKLFQIDNYLGVSGEVDAETYAALASKQSKPTIKVPVAPSTAAWMAIAEKELGQEEIAGSVHNPRIIAYHATTTLKATKDETPWCSSFVNWVMIQAGKKGTNSAAAISWQNWGKATPSRTGAIVVLHNTSTKNSSLSYSGYHVAFLLKETATHYHVLGGNQRNKVKKSRYSKKSWRLTACRWPK